MDFEFITDNIIKEKSLVSNKKIPSATSVAERILKDLKIEPLISLSESHDIRSKSDASQALSMGMQARKIRKRLEVKRLKVVRPYVLFQREVNSIVKGYSEKLQRIEDNLKLKLDTWLKVQSTFEPNFSDLMIEVQDGTISTVIEYEFTLEDIKKIPISYLMIDEKKVKEAIKMGVRDIPGIKIFETKKTKMRVKN